MCNICINIITVSRSDYRLLSCSLEGGSPDISSNVGAETRDVSAAAAAAVANSATQANTTIATQTDASAAGRTMT